MSIKNKLKQYRLIFMGLFGIGLSWFHTITLANAGVGKLPTLPSDEIIGGDQGIVDIFINWVSKIGKPGIVAVGALVFVKIALGLSDAYKEAQESDKMGKFWAVLFAALAAGGFALTILYAAWQMVGGTQS